MTLVNEVRGQRAEDGTAGNQTLSCALEDAYRKIRAATTIAVDYEDVFSGTTRGSKGQS